VGWRTVRRDWMRDDDLLAADVVRLVGSSRKATQDNTDAQTAWNTNANAGRAKSNGEGHDPGEPNNLANGHAWPFTADELSNAISKKTSHLQVSAS
jgi:hypothetical protein